MKKIFAIFLSFLLLSVSSFAQSNHKEAWYFSSKSQNDRPTLPSVDPGLAKGIGEAQKVLYLTFDAGYENGNVEKIVDILNENQVPGAFFVLKHFVEANPDLCIKIKESGHLICNHTSTHPQITSLTKEELEHQIRELEEVYRTVVGKDLDPYFRPPEGVWSRESLETVKSLGYRTVFWSLAWADWDNNNQKTPEYAMEKLTKRVHDGAVILLHPTSETNTKILGQFISQMKEKGYRFGTLEELWQTS